MNEEAKIGGIMEEPMQRYVQREFFDTALFNNTFYKFNDTLLIELIKNYRLTPVKGGSQFEQLSDFPYYVHIINGLYPTALFLEELLIEEYGVEYIDKGILEDYLKTFIVAFSLHDINKLTNENLEVAVSGSLEKIINEIHVEEFFPNWREYLEEIKFIILKTEERTRDFANKLNIKERGFVNDFLAECSQLGDKIASQDIQIGVFEFIENLNNLQFRGYTKLKEVSERFQKISCTYVDKNIYTLLSQKLLSVAAEYLTNNKGFKIIFSFRNGLIYLGSMLEESDLNAIVENFVESYEEEIDYVSNTTIKRDKCKFGFLDTIPLDEKKLEKIIVENIQRQLFYINNEEYEKNKELIDDLLDEIEAIIEIKESKNRRREVENYFFVLPKEWEDLEKNERLEVLCLGLQKIKFLALKKNKVWRKEWDEIRKQKKDILSKFKPNVGTDKTMGAILWVYEKLEEKEPKELYGKLRDDVISTFNKEKTKLDRASLEELAKRYLNGDFQKPIDWLNFDLSSVPEKEKICLVCGSEGEIEIDESKVFGFSSRKFSSNRNLNRLNFNKQYLCSLCYYETMLRRTIFPKSTGASACIYFDIGDYFFFMDKSQLRDIFQKALELGTETLPTTPQITIERFNLRFDYPFIFYNLQTDTKKHFGFLQNLLNMISNSGFKLYVLDIITPFDYQKEMFVFDNSMPFIKNAYWDRIRIDEIPRTQEELQWLRHIGDKQLNSLLLDYVGDRKALFTYFYNLDEEKRRRVKYKLWDFVNSRKEVYKMSLMEELADLAAGIEWSRGTTSSETRILRTALEVLKNGVKEGRGREDVVQQIAGQLYKDFGSPYKREAISQFAERIYDKLYKEEWKEQIPRPNRLKNWVYQFAFLYSTKSDEAKKEYGERRKEVEQIVKSLKEQGGKADWENVKQVIERDYEKKKYIRDYESIYIRFFRKEESS